MFSQEPRCIYEKNPILEAICQFRFPEILAIGAKPPVDFQEEIRDVFPRYNLLREVQAPRVTGAPGSFSMTQPVETLNHQFQSADGAWRVNLTTKFISFACSRYTAWEDFAAMLDKPLASFLRIYKPAYYERVGLRYVNAISRRDLGLEGEPFRELIEPYYLGLLGDEQVQETSATRSTMDAELALRGGCRGKIHAGPGSVKRNGQNDPEPKFILDNDLYMIGQTPVNLSAGALQTLHVQADELFRGAITDRLHEAMGPRD